MDESGAQYHAFEASVLRVMEPVAYRMDVRGYPPPDYSRPVIHNFYYPQWQGDCNVEAK